jgi:hypothetical protein
MRAAFRFKEESTINGVAFQKRLVMAVSLLPREHDAQERQGQDGRYQPEDRSAPHGASANGDKLSYTLQFGGHLLNGTPKWSRS